MNIRTILSIFYLFLLSLSSSAQVVSTNPSLMEISEESGKIKSTEIFVFRSPVSLEDELDEVDYYDSHFLGDMVAKKNKIINDLYVKHTEVAVGFGNSQVEIQKPIVYNALNKLESQIKKDLKKGKVSKEEAEAAYSRYLDYAYVIYFETDIESFENLLRKSRSTSEIIEAFGSVSIEKL